MADGTTIVRGLLGAAQVGDGPTAEQIRVLQSLLHGYFRLDTDVTSLTPMSATEFATEFAAVVDASERKRVVDLLVVVEFCRHTDEELQAQRAEECATALGADEPFLTVARDALTEGHERVMADWSRFREAPSEESGLAPTDAELATQLRSLAACPPGSLGRAYFDFLDIRGKGDTLARPGASDELAEAFRRGVGCEVDFSAIGHLRRADEPLDVVRDDCGIPPRAAAA